MSFTIDPTKAQSMEIIQAVKQLRAAAAQVETVSNIVANMTDAQISSYTAFSGTAAQLKTILADANTILQNTAALTNLMTQLVW